MCEVKKVWFLLSKTVLIRFIETLLWISFGLRATNRQILLSDPDRVYTQILLMQLLKRLKISFYMMKDSLEEKYQAEIKFRKAENLRSECYRNP